MIKGEDNSIYSFSKAQQECYSRNGYISYVTPRVPTTAS